ncbi:MAG: hypothetical protein CM1200mP18_13550 [Gammaproteobacteria bacterium]|nr:MAG: hypothetical protein CM1200mP18_13550 [Gammaproteobacteria bacterium]
MISGSIDDVSLGWLPRMQEYRIPTLDTWTSYIGIIDMIVEDRDAMRPYFMNIASDEALATLYISFGADVLKAKMGFESVVVLAEDTAFGQAITGLVTEALAPVAGIEVKDVISYDINTVDFAPVFAKAQNSGADFIYQISSVNSQVMSSQYVKLQVPMAMTGVNVSALGLEYWDDTGGNGGGISTLFSPPVRRFRPGSSQSGFRRYLPGQVHQPTEDPSLQWVQCLPRTETSHGGSGGSRRFQGCGCLGCSDAKAGPET